MAILMFGEQGAEIVYPDPGFPIYRSMIEFTGATPVPAPMREANGFAFSAEETLALDHAEDPAPDPQFARQPDRGASRRPRQIDRLVAGPRRLSGRRDPVRRDLRPAHLRRARPPLASRLSRDPRPADPARRLVEDLRDDRLAARLFGVAEAVAGGGAQARGQFLFLRQFGGAVRRNRGARRARRIRSRRCGPSSTAGGGRSSRA